MAKILLILHISNFHTLTFWFSTKSRRIYPSKTEEYTANKIKHIFGIFLSFSYGFTSQEASGIVAKCRVANIQIEWTQLCLLINKHHWLKTYFLSICIVQIIDSGAPLNATVTWYVCWMFHQWHHLKVNWVVFWLVKLSWNRVIYEEIIYLLLSHASTFWSVLTSSTWILDGTFKLPEISLIGLVLAE